MKSKRQKTFALAVTLVGLLALAWLPGDGGISVGADGTTLEKIIVSIANDLTDDTLYTLNPDGSGKAKLFDFHSHSRDATARIYDLRVAPDGGAIYSSSDHARYWTPADYNLFRIASDGSWHDQITPGPQSGLWDQPCPCGSVEGKVYESSTGPPLAGQVFLEGKDSVWAGTDGSYHFDNVPVGKRWIVAYQDGFTYNQAVEIYVPSGSAAHQDLTPEYSYRMAFQRPVLYGSRIYHMLDMSGVQWTGVNASAYTNVYSATQGCGIPGVNGFDVARTSGKLAIMDFELGCPTIRGLYTTDKDGNNRQLLVDMASDANWRGGEDVFWSPDESKLAFKGSYYSDNVYVYLLVYDATSGSLLGSVYFADPNYNLGNVYLYGWSPDGGWLLYSSWLSQPSAGVLSKIKVNADGSFDTGSIVNLLTNTFVSGATWGTLKSPQHIYLPLVVRNS
jgi:hypothetical protein